jgi:hypothetical protein
MLAAIICLLSEEQRNVSANHFTTASLNRLWVLGLRTGRNKLLTFANSISGKNTRTSWGWWKSLFIVEIEGSAKNSDVTRWGQFTDIKDIKKEIFQRLENRFENWLNS